MGAPSLKIAHVGSFHVGGRQVQVDGQDERTIAFTRSTSFTYNPNGLYHVEQAYVQYFIPEQPISRIPIVLLHGGGFSGAMWEATPDGRTGWLQILLGLGFTVYVVDNVERGRAGWCALPGVWPGDAIVRSAQEAWGLFRFGRSEDFPRRTPFPGQRFPTDHLDTFIMGHIPRWLTTGEAAVSTFEAVLQRIGPCCVIAHSQGGEVAFRAAARHPALVPCLIALEPSGFPDDPAAFANRSVLAISGDYVDATPLWVSLTERTQAFVEALDEAGASASLWSLPKMGISGNSHMIMMDDNNSEIAEMLSRWILERELQQATA
ncbi:alpha/beta fold hydrolase [Microvirga sp. HBU67558]|uniref:alpha/beta fold hydrolase n=1 Tax=Microvirga TaxID=186650 RepID=UPI001B3807D5|nr:MULTISPECIES: alpha/beta fold hydrolase [unclassified Microvirga]MBQ0819495.1 alpha/beta fold hydrolase [Microvirga sp. HBU67558]